MITAEQGKQLHDKVSRGESLSAQEQAELEEWYSLQDSIENKELGLPVAEKTLATLHAQVDAALAQMTTLTRRIQDVASENEMLRREIADLRQQLAGLSPQSV